MVTQCLIEDTPVLPRKASVPGNYPGELDFIIMVLILMGLMFLATILVNW